MPLLLHIMDDRVIHKFALKPGTVTIGRSGDNNIKLDDKIISGHHARLTIRQHHNPYLNILKEVELEDLESTNGSFINGTKITKQMLSNGDVLRFGHHTFKYVDTQELE